MTPKPYDLTSPAEVRRLFAELHGYLTTCRSCGTDPEGRRCALRALEDVIAAADLDPPSPTREELLNEVQRLQAELWNAKHPEGTPVQYWTGVKEGPGESSRTRSAARLLPSGYAVVWVDGQAGCIALTHVQPAPPLSGAQFLALAQRPDGSSIFTEEAEAQAVRDAGLSDVPARTRSQAAGPDAPRQRRDVVTLLLDLPLTERSGRELETLGHMLSGGPQPDHHDLTDQGRLLALRALAEGPLPEGICTAAQRELEHLQRIMLEEANTNS